jgi:sulfite dehydrogenase (quinone) subunit SoeA
VIRNACQGDPYRIDTLFLFMANMGWNSSMNTGETRRMLTQRDSQGGEYTIPHFIYADAFWSETVAFADLVLPDTTYLERHDCISMLDRPISDADSASDSIRQPIVPLDRDVRPFQDVLLDLGARLNLPGMTNGDGSPKYPQGFAQYMVEHERTPGVGLLAGWRGADGKKQGIGEPNPRQLDVYKANNCFWQAHVPESARYYKMANRDYLEWAHSHGFASSTNAIVLELYSEKMQKFRLAAQGHGERQPPDSERARVEKYFDPLPFWYGDAAIGAVERERDDAFSISAITQRPMFMYHSWGSQNAWLRQIATRNFLYVHPQTAKEFGIDDGDDVCVESAHGVIRVPARLHTGTAPGTVWTWNAIGKRRDAWKLAADAPEYTKGFLLNHVIDDLMPPRADGYRYTNADPVTGQAAWFDLRVKIYPASKVMNKTEEATA